MKVGIIGFCNLNIMQYLYKYTNLLDAEGIDYDVIYWNRFGIKEKVTFSGNAISYNRQINTYQPFYKKIRMFIEYAAFMRRLIRKNKYDKLIVLTTQTAIPLYDILCGKYCEKYIFDFRDITKEKKSYIYKKAVQKIIDRAFYTMMSSEGFIAEVEPRKIEKIQIAHNTQVAQKSTYTTKIKVATNPIKIVFWGIVRQLEHNKKFCDCFGGDSRFCLIFHGTGGYEQLSNYCSMKKYKNVFFTGVFEQKDIPSFAEETDVLHCVYENDDEQQPAMPVKAYDAIKYRLPVLIIKDSQAANFFNGISGALAIDLDDNDVADKVYTWFHSLDEIEVEKDYRYLEDKVVNDDLRFNEKLKIFVGAKIV